MHTQMHLHNLRQCLGVGEERQRVGRGRVGHVRGAEVLDPEGGEEPVPFAHPRPRGIEDLDAAFQQVRGARLPERRQPLHGVRQGLCGRVEAEEVVEGRVGELGAGQAADQGQGARAGANDGEVEHASGVRGVDGCD